MPLVQLYQPLFGIMEPLLFGINLRSLRILFRHGWGAIGGLMTYGFQLQQQEWALHFIPWFVVVYRRFRRHVEIHCSDPHCV